MPPARVATTGVADASASSTVFGRPSTFPASSTTDGVAAMSAAASQSATSPWATGAEERDTVGHIPRRGPLAQLGIEIVPAGNDEPEPGMTRRQQRDGIDQVFEPFLADQASHREDDRIIRADAMPGAHAHAGFGVWCEPVSVDAMEQCLGATVLGAERHRLDFDAFP